MRAARNTTCFRRYRWEQLFGHQVNGAERPIDGEKVRRERRWTSAGETPARELVRSTTTLLLPLRVLITVTFSTSSPVYANSFIHLLWVCRHESSDCRLDNHTVS